MENNLSKPVAYDYQIASACIADGHNENGKWVDWNNKLTRHCPPDWMMEEGKVTGLKLLYSQEYVSALLAELEAKDTPTDIRVAEIEKRLKQRAEEMERILEGITPEMIAGGWTAKGISDYAKSLEAKLATPVRLKKVDSSNVPFAGDGFNAAVDYCADRVRAAGFTVEGDE
ncbi:hypothetical protein NMO37_000325 [Serratia marcescens]